MHVDDLENDKHAYRADLARAARNEWRQMAVDILMRSPGPLPAREIADRTATPIAPTVNRLRQWPAYFMHRRQGQPHGLRIRSASASGGA
jgi:hypothetical protein